MLITITGEITRMLDAVRVVPVWEHEPDRATLALWRRKGTGALCWFCDKYGCCTPYGPCSAATCAAARSSCAPRGQRPSWTSWSPGAAAVRRLPASTLWTPRPRQRQQSFPTSAFAATAKPAKETL